MKSWQSIDQTTSYSIIFLDVECRLSIDATVARIPVLESRPLRVFLFSSTDGFRPSIATSLMSSSKDQNGNITNITDNPSSSLYQTAAPLFIDVTRPGALYVDCHDKGSAAQVQRNVVPPAHSYPMPIIAIYDVQRKLTAYRLVPLPDHPATGGNVSPTLGLEKIWMVDFSDAGWIDHPNDIRFVGSENHLLVHHVNGDITAIELFDRRHTITDLFDAMSENKTLSSERSLSMTLTPATRDKNNLSDGTFDKPLSSCSKFIKPFDI